MQTLSLAMIVRNEERTLAPILACAQGFCDELVVVDTGSTDATVQIAESMGAMVSYFTWVDDFAAARNASFARCTSDWIIWLDADDILTESSQRAIRAYKSSLFAQDGLDAVFLPYDTGRVKTVRERILRRAANFTWAAPIHEIICVPHGRSVIRDDAVVVHRLAKRLL